MLARSIGYPAPGGRAARVPAEWTGPRYDDRREVIRATGMKEFSESVGIPSPNVLRAINPKHNPTQETLERLLKPFGLRIGLAQIKPRKKGRVA